MKPYSGTPAVRMTPLAERAVAKLDAWLRGYEADREEVEAREAALFEVA